MGSGQSARKLTISNEEEVGVIKVSNAIVQRLAQGERSKSHKPLPDEKPAAPIQDPVNPPDASEATTGQPVYYPELTVSALQIQQQMEEELNRQNQYWQRRLQTIEDSYQKINRVLEEEYKKAANESSVAKSEGQTIANIQNVVQPCLENSNKVLKCFQDHPKETLKCSDLVEEFSNCVWKVHTCMIETRS
ncbi:PREDICTED: MICOS complex subunit MIC19 [Acromyrmex echinatior]|uniref:Coiled-coil-helix-coiled-coil-helix domain-containing protein 3, mitochondrial n=2 Tax=Acromyrmex TaxID=64782 RepID=F4WLT5_ACREC